MSILDEGKTTESGEGGMPKVKVTPPPPPPSMQMSLGILFAGLALGAAFWRSWPLCTLFTGLALLANVVVAIALGKRDTMMPFVPVPPPPPPPTGLLRLLMLVLAALAMVFVLLRWWELSVTFTALTLAVDVWAFAALRAWSRRAAAAAAEKTAAG